MNDTQVSYLQIHPKDNMLVALKDLDKSFSVDFNGKTFNLKDNIQGKHKFSATDLQVGDPLYMYGVLVGKTKTFVPAGGALTVANVVHATASFGMGQRKLEWQKPDTTNFDNLTFNGFARSDGSVGTANYWLVIPMVFCENRNVAVLKEALVEKLGYKRAKGWATEVDQLISLYQSGQAVHDILAVEFEDCQGGKQRDRVFPNVDGIKFLTHDLGCGGIRMDSDALCGLLAGYITHPNVAGATVLSLGCQHAQTSILMNEIYKRDSKFDKPLVVLEQQISGTENQMLKDALKQTFAGLLNANQQKRTPAPLHKLCIGLECGGSDGFSGISANPAIGYVSDLLVALGGSVILSEFPELCGVEQELSDRCVNESVAQRFMNLMTTYNARAEQDGSGFYANPSPGNISDGLITDAIKSAGAAKKGGNSPVVAILDYPEKVTEAGLNLLCTPGSDVESTTAEVAAGANIVLFTTGLGTPTGNPIAPVIKISTNSALARKMPDIIDIDCGTIIEGTESIEASGERILHYIINVASGIEIPKAVSLEQDDFIPWKRGVSL
ncbi:altronate dehydratase family protein [Pedobacter sp. KR3-3]|uniref:Altronate dehydratase family protein n=1 Tax=Pedobacter albus TaxID=3113905 RepID=A0ABU7I716_9SPHI|nr:altronate dehydratase family protein [Pedobacter sp. KR3-3]MEE1945265.1 altronate dehydratase family protein [Pedobacter sp. KR3-3]